MAIYVTQLHDYLTLFAVSLTFLRIRYRSISIKIHSIYYFLANHENIRYENEQAYTFLTQTK